MESHRLVADLDLKVFIVLLDFV